MNPHFVFGQALRISHEADQRFELGVTVEMIAIYLFFDRVIAWLQEQAELLRAETAALQRATAATEALTTAFAVADAELQVRRHRRRR